MSPIYALLFPFSIFVLQSLRDFPRLLSRSPPPLNQTITNKLYSNALFMRSQHPQKKFMRSFV